MQSVMSKLQRLEGHRVKQKRHYADEGNPIIVAPRLFVEVAGDYDLAETVAAVAKRESLLTAFLGVGNSVCRLDVDLFVAFVDDKVYFALSDFMFAIDPCFVLDDADVNGISTTEEFAVDHIFHQMSPLVLSKVDAGIPKTGVGGIVFDGRFKISAALDIVAIGLTDEKGIGQVVEIAGDSDCVRLCSCDGVYGVGDFAGVGKASDTAHDHIDQRFHERGILDLIALDDVTKIDCPVKIGQICLSFGIGLCEGAFGESAEGQVLVEDLLRFTTLPQGHKFGEGQRRDQDGLSATAEYGCHVRDQHLGVGSSHIDIDARGGAEFAQNAVEGDVRTLAVIGMNESEIGSRRKDLLAVLYLVNEDVCPASVLLDALLDVIKKGDGVEKGLGSGGLKVNFDDVVLVDAALEQMVLEKREKQKALAASANAADNLDEVVVLGIDELLQ